MAESSIQEQFACTGCGVNLLRIDVTAPIPLPRLAEFYEMMVAQVRSITLCGKCQNPPGLDDLLSDG